MRSACHVLGLSVLVVLLYGTSPAAVPDVEVNTPLPPPAWALLERELLRANAAACREFYQRYFDERGYILCVLRWGADDGPDDAIESVNDWPLLHALGGPQEVYELYRRVWEGHLRQYTEARTVEVPLARDGMYYREFPVMMDWLHNGEGLTVFNLQGLSDPRDPLLRQRAERYARFYTGDDPQAPNYDAQHRLIRSMFNGSRGPLLRKATPLDWAGDPIEIEGRFRPRHGERNYQEMLEHFRDYTDIVGDHPQNLLATTLALNAYMLTHDPRYRAWLLEYVDAWCERAAANGGILPSNVGLDGTIGGSADGKWYGGVYGWGFTVRDPATGQMAHRNTCHLAVTGFGNALLVSGKPEYVDTWRRQIRAVHVQARLIDGRLMYPRMYADQGWYDFHPEPYSHGALEVYYWSCDTQDADMVPPNPWLDFLAGRRPEYPVEALQRDLEGVRRQVAAMREDASTPDTRLSDDVMVRNPVHIRSLVELALGGLHPGHVGGPLHCRLRYFDPVAQRPGLPQDVAALVEALDATSVRVTLVNINQLEPRTLILQAGAYAEHQFTLAETATDRIELNAPRFTLSLQAGCGTTLTLHQLRYANPPTLDLPW
jgi:hypothetical protein